MLIFKVRLTSLNSFWQELLQNLLFIFHVEVACGRFFEAIFWRILSRCRRFSSRHLFQKPIFFTHKNFLWLISNELLRVIVSRQHVILKIPPLKLSFLNFSVKIGIQLSGIFSNNEIFVSFFTKCKWILCLSWRKQAIMHSLKINSKCFEIR